MKEEKKKKRDYNFQGDIPCLVLKIIEKVFPLEKKK